MSTVMSTQEETDAVVRNILPSSPTKSPSTRIPFLDESEPEKTDYKSK